MIRRIATPMLAACLVLGAPAAALADAFSEPVLIAPDETRGVEIHTQHLSEGPGGVSHAVWIEAGTNRVLYQRMDGEGTPDLARVVWDAAGNATRTGLAVNQQTGLVHVTYEWSNAGNDRLAHVTIDDAGEVSEPAIVAGYDEVLGHDSALGSDGNLYVAWRDDDEASIEWGWFTPGGDYTYGASLGEGFWPRIAVGPGNIVHVVWARQAGPDVAVEYARNLPGDGPDGVQVIDALAEGASDERSIAVGADGRAHVTFTREDEDEVSEGWYRAVDADGIPEAGAVLLSGGDNVGVSELGMHLGTDGRVHYVYEGYDDDEGDIEQVYYGVVGVDGAVAAGPVLVSSDVRDGRRPVIGAHGADTIHIVWDERAPEGGFRTVIQHRSITGAAELGEVTTASSTPPEPNEWLGARFPRMAVGADGDIHLIWEQRGTNEGALPYLMHYGFRAAPAPASGPDPAPEPEPEPAKPAPTRMSVATRQLDARGNARRCGSQARPCTMRRGSRLAVEARVSPRQAARGQVVVFEYLRPGAGGGRVARRIRVTANANGVARRTVVPPAGRMIVRVRVPATETTRAATGNLQYLRVLPRR